MARMFSDQLFVPATLSLHARIFSLSFTGESEKRAIEISSKEGLLYLDEYDNPHAIAGLGTMGLEILEQVPDVDAIIIPTGS